jgi:adenylate cyclase
MKLLNPVNYIISEKHRFKRLYCLFKDWKKMMQRYLLLIVLGLVFSTAAFSQKQGQKRLDSLLAELPKAKEDTNKIKLLSAICRGYERINPDEGIKYGEQALALAKRSGWKKGEALALNALGINNTAKASYHKAIEYYMPALKIYEALDIKPGVATTLDNIGTAHYRLADNGLSLECYLKALDINKELGNRSAIASSFIHIGFVYFDMEQYPKALDNMDKALKMYEESGDKAGISSSYNGIGAVYQYQGRYEAALAMYDKSLKISKELGNKAMILNTMGNVGNVYIAQKKYREALSYNVNAMVMAEEIGDKRNVAHGYASIGEVYLKMAKDSGNDEGRRLASDPTQGNLQQAVLHLHKGIEMFKLLGMIGELPDHYKYLSEAYTMEGNYKAALEAHIQHAAYKDSVLGKESKEKIARLEMQGEYHRKQLADSLKLQKQKTYTYVGMGAVLLLLGFSFFVVRSNKLLGKEKQKSEDLLLNILPSEIADELKDRGATTAKHFDEVTVLFTDFVNFTGAGERMGTQKLVEELHNCFKAFDEIIGRYNIEKIKTIGDAYLAVSGLPVPDDRHAQNVMNAAIEIRSFMLQRKKEGHDTFEIRIGIHTGPVVAGIVGVKKFAYDIWGDTVNTAARMEQKSEAGKINISQTTYELVKDKFSCTYRGEVDAKNKGMLKMYFVEGVA